MSANFDTENLMNFSEEDEQLWSLLSAYVDGETTSAEAAIVEAHLRSDATYAQDFAFLKATARRVDKIGEVAPPTHLRDAIFAATVNKPTISRRFAKAMTQLQSAISPRHALPMGVLAAGVLAAFMFVPKTADNHAGITIAGAETRTAVPDTNSAPKAGPDVTLESKPAISKTTMDAAKVAQKSVRSNFALPNEPTIDLRSIFNTSGRENVKTIANKKQNVPHVVIPVFATVKTQQAAPKIVKAFVQSTTPMQKTGDMFPDFSLKPNMDRDSQRTIARNDPPVEPITSDDVTLSPADTTPTAAVETSDATPKTVRLRSGRTLPDVRRIATASQLRKEQSEFQQGMTHNTMLAMQRDELSGSTVTRF